MAVKYQAVEVHMPDGRIGRFVGPVFLNEEEIARLENHELRVGMTITPVLTIDPTEVPPAGGS